MITRLKVDGFKNLIDVDLLFGPFTCIAGANGVGKSNLFDAIAFLSALAEYPLLEAALMVRDEEGRTGDIRSLFTRYGSEYAPVIRFEAEMIIPASGHDDLGQRAEASITFVRYTLHLRYQEGDSLRSMGRLALDREDLVHINIGDARRHLPFGPTGPWRKSAVHGRRTSPFISTERDGDVIIKRHQEGRAGRTLRHAAAQLPRTVLSVANASEAPTALLARREMQSWRQLQLEPSSLRRPDDFTATPRLGANGAHLPATLYRLAQADVAEEIPAEQAATYARVANRLSELLGDVRRVHVDRDDKRELLTLEVEDRTGTTHSARALSDGTLRFLALAVLDLDPEARGVVCLEEPENGIHPARIPAILDLLQDIATDSSEPVGPENPLRQVIINTHSPAVVQQVPEDTLVVAEAVQHVINGQVTKSVHFNALDGTWRTEADVPLTPAGNVSLGHLLAYLNPGPSSGDGMNETSSTLRVMDREDVRQYSLFS